MAEIKTYILENLTTLLGYIIGGGSFYGYFLERKKRTIEEKQISADALKTMQEGYDKFTANAMEQYDTLRKEVSDLKKKLTDVSTELDEEKGKYNKLKNAYDSLKREFDNYKKKHNI
jgi:chromosome segregation ATPase